MTMAKVATCGVRYSFAGQYYAKAGAKKELKNYELDVVFAESTPKALSIFRSAIMDPGSNIRKLMVQKYPDFARVRTHIITGEENLSDPGKAPKDVARMNKKQLAKYIADNELAIDIEVYGDNVADVRQAIADCEENPEAFAVKHAKQKEEFKTKKMLNDLNPVDGDDKGGNGEAPDADDLLNDLDGDDKDIDLKNE